jgi:type III restriction enzyme
VLSLQGFVRELAQQTKLSVHTISGIVAHMPAEKFAQIRHNESRALLTLRDLILRCVHELLVNKVSYELREVRVKTALTDNTGALLKTIPLALCGSETHVIGNPVVQEKSLYAERVMPVDSQIERDTVDESQHNGITVFAKLPKINIPTPAGKYNPDFGYVIRRAGATEALYLVVETKGYDTEADIPEREHWKIQSARRFFAALKAQGIPVKYETKINHAHLAQLIDSLAPQSSGSD